LLCLTSRFAAPIKPMQKYPRADSYNGVKLNAS
jgi:hypothetical protein